MVSYYLSSSKVSIADSSFLAEVAMEARKVFVRKKESSCLHPKEETPQARPCPLYHARFLLRRRHPSISRGNHTLHFSFPQALLLHPENIVQMRLFPLLHPCMIRLLVQ